MRVVNAYTRFHFFDVAVKKSHQGHLDFHATLKLIFYSLGIERLFSLNECVVSLIYGKQQLV